MTDNLIAGLIVAFLTGLTILAQKYPRLYRPIFPALVILTAFVCLDIVTYRYGSLGEQLRELEKYLAEESGKTLGSVSSSINGSRDSLYRIVWTPIVVLGINAYFIFLWFLPRLIRYARTAAKEESASDEK